MNASPDSAARWRRLADLFDALIDAPQAEQETALARLRTEDPDLARDLERMLDADRRDSGLLDRGLAPAVASGALDAASRIDRTGTRIDDYTLARRIGRGGMGDVYLAERAGEGFTQQVAIKLLRRGVDTEDVVRRFAQERRILAQLEHPGIARLIDGGVAPDGSPYLVMELVDGEPLAKFAQANALSVEQRVLLVIAICEAVDFAHRRLVVHRDLKPSNVLVTADGTPKLLDFGIAKLIGEGNDGSADQVTVTGAEMRVMSPAYAAPEQIAGEPVGTTTDVYALGVILYELLTGKLPHDRGDHSLAALARALDTESIARPSVRLLEGERTLDTTRRARALEGDLDTIVLHALAREPDRRYPSAAALAEDLTRFLEGRPIKARPDTWSYRVGKFVGRHRGSVTVALLMLGGLIAALGVALWQADRARTEARNAATQAERAERVKDFVLALFREQDPLTREKAKAATAGELIARGIASAQKDFAQDPALESEIVGDLAQLQFSLGDVKDARASFERVAAQRRTLHGEDSIPYGIALADLGGAQLAMGERELAGPTIEQSVAILRKRAGPDALETANAEMRLQRLLLERGQKDESLALAQHVLAIYVREKGEAHAETLRRRYNLGVVYEQMDRLEDAEKEFREVIAAHARSGSPDHVQLVYPRTLLGDVLRRRRDYAGAAQVYDEALDVATREIGPTSRVAGQIAMRRGDLLRRLRRYDDALASLTLAEQVFQPIGSPELGQVYVYRGQILREQGRLADALKYYEQGGAHYAKTIGEDSLFARGAELGAATIRAEMGDVDRAVADATRVASALRANAKPDSFEHAYAAENRGDVLAIAGRHEEALVEHRTARDVLAKLYGEDHGGVATLDYAIAKDLIALKQNPDEARTRLTHAIEVTRKADPTDPALEKMEKALQQL